MVLFQVLGPLEVRGRDGVTRRPAGGKPATVLAALLMQPNAWVAVDRLIENTWPEQAAPASAEANLKTYMWQLRRLLPEHDAGPRIEGRAGAYRLHVGPGELDADCAMALADDATRALAAGTPGTALALGDKALRLWRGRPFEGLYVLADDAVERLGELHRRLRESLADAQLGLGRTADAVATLQALTADDPLREDVWARLIRAQHEMGRPAQALATFHRARRLLAAELGVRPGPELRKAFQAVHGSGAPDRPRRELPRIVEPLAGREREFAALERALTGRAPAVVVAGAAGAGKTALAVAAAHRVSERFPDGQFFVDLHGGSRPLSIAAVLERLLRGLGLPPALIPSDVDERAALWRSELAGRRVLVVFDDAATRSQVAALLPATGRSAAIVTTRARDFSLAGAMTVHLGPKRASARQLERVA
ncbi:BTAD domain-containing putative transcriptional regulator [Amycolatopsis japonica]|uniref:AfsR/SARP family transcriptional regulator n=1 Tax=Amycolatopsis japonica TaxID=208439 RepID=UPI003672565E